MSTYLKILVIDVGAGKGYLATSLYQNYKIPVLAIDSCESRHKSALNRQELIKKKTHESFPLVHHSVQFIDDTVDYSKLVQKCFKINDNTINKKDNFLLAGLHTCGSLAVAMIKAFLNSNCLKSLCVVACCYHLTDESLTGTLKLSKNSRMLAQQSVDRSIVKKQLSPSLFYRALLQVLLKSFDSTHVKIGKGGPLNDFPTYAMWALNKIGLPENQIPSLSELTNLYNTHADKEWKLNAFQYLRIHLGSIIEAAIILDRVVYLERSKKCSKLSIVRLFNPLLSPRCYAIVALK
ncbi:methyltransferase-like protein 25 isoform X2 [Chelonus insularis]|uniref:methyltransferase-like protein 25 isoform X2 n=1 Tax=Chelonus insularis TaxID=460826 RepID=UPI00158D25F8|nr:methyltransferase-like protein 25 isoform X2 [Chelonus insularis]